MSTDLYNTLTDQAVKARMAPYIDTLAKEAARVSKGNKDFADFVTATIVAESGGRANAIGDDGEAKGLFQVQDKYMRDWGFDPKKDGRMDPEQAIRTVLPVLFDRYNAANGNWGATRLQFMRGRGHPATKAAMRGVDPIPHLVGQPVALDQFKQFTYLQNASRERRAATAQPQATSAPAAAPSAPPPTYVPYDALGMPQGGGEAAMTPVDWMGAAPAPAKRQRQATQPRKQAQQADQSLAVMLAALGIQPLVPELGV